MGVPAIPISDGKRVRLMQLKLPEIVARLKAVESELKRLREGALEHPDASIGDRE
jgi:hypothetical protein